MSFKCIFIGSDHIYTFGNGTVHFRNMSLDVDSIMLSTKPYCNILDYALRYITFMDPGVYMIRQHATNVYQNIFTGKSVHDGDFATLFSYTNMILKLFTTSV